MSESAGQDSAQQAEFRNRQIGFIFQDHHLLPQCTVLENVLIPTLPGAATSRVTSGEAAIFQASACSRPPEPTMRMFMRPGFGVMAGVGQGVRLGL